jgi:hypothetical protein
MMSRRGIRRPSRSEVKQLNVLRKIIHEMTDILQRCPRPDIFLGRKTQEPFPQQKCHPQKK